ncbi:hypothetical protein [Bradyrhizobium sp. CSA112]|uniref:hypothetical protein n=1 Tax=Bradyrhizobium sp. CSA112 TaxID=2699170 RepID=UPI0023AF55CB|nr:hypothetical protein [Bradyrhizobium sp. CSA112]
MSARTAADDKEANKAKECMREFHLPKMRARNHKSFHACHKNRIADPSIAMQVKVPVRHAQVSMLIRL